MDGDKERGEEASKEGEKIGREGSKRVFDESPHFSSQETKSTRSSDPTDVCLCVSGPADHMTIPA